MKHFATTMAGPNSPRGSNNFAASDNAMRLVMISASFQPGTLNHQADDARSSSGLSIDVPTVP